MENEDFYIKKMERRGIRPTPMRVLILKEMYRGDVTVSLPDMEHFLPSVDKSTISRTINTFLDHHLLHVVDDGSGALKYAVCSDCCDCYNGGGHVHFYCEKCKRTFCLKGIHIPEVKLPGGFTVDGVNFVIKGVCPECNGKKKAE